VIDDIFYNWDVICRNNRVCSFPLSGWLCKPSSLLSIVFQWPFVWRSSVQSACFYPVSRSRNQRYWHFNGDMSWCCSVSHSVIYCMLNGWGCITNRVEFFFFTSTLLLGGACLTFAGPNAPKHSGFKRPLLA
jgi:hypothetical protein